MARKPEPRWYPSRGAWYVCVNGKQHRLAVGREAKPEALKAYHRLMIEERGPAKSDRISVSLLCDLLLDWTRDHREPLTYEFYRRHLQRFCDTHGAMKADEVTTAHVSRWLARSGWGPSTKHGAVTAVQRAFRWGHLNGFLESNPVLRAEKPPMEPRGQIMTAEQFIIVLDDAPPSFRDLLEILHETGMRPSEAYRIEAANVDWERSHAIFHRHKTRSKTKRPRVVYLTPRALEILKRLASSHPQGPLLRNSQDGPWTRHAVAHRFGRLRVRLGMGSEATAESLRHLFVTDALDAGVPIATVAQLAGHRSTRQIEATYSHLSDRAKHLHDAVSRIRGGKVSADDNPDKP